MAQGRAIWRFGNSPGELSKKKRRKFVYPSKELFVFACKLYNEQPMISVFLFTFIGVRYAKQTNVSENIIPGTDGKFDGYRGYLKRNKTIRKWVFLRYDNHTEISQSESSDQVRSHYLQLILLPINVGFKKDPSHSGLVLHSTFPFPLPMAPLFMLNSAVAQNAIHKRDTFNNLLCR